MTRADEQRDTPLARELKESIRRDGPVSVAAFMQTCLAHPEHGYYRGRPAIGAKADFITAPEISQVFGELIGLWSAVVWQQMSSPPRFNLVELGPGRGTLMRDALRATRIVAGFRDALSLHLVESNATLREAQRSALAESGIAPAFHDDVYEALATPGTLGDAPTVLVANEFLDTLPVDQFEFHDAAWYMRSVALAGERLSFRPNPSADRHPDAPDGLAPRDGDILEVSHHHRAMAHALLARARSGPMAALFIDYGHERTGFGDTLSGIAAQASVSPFFAPGETDLSAQVDFAHFADACRAAGLAVDGPVTQAEFLGALGIVERASRLMSANPALAATIEAGVARLIAPSGMGSRFKAIGVRSASLPPLPGFA